MVTLAFLSLASTTFWRRFLCAELSFFFLGAPVSSSWLVFFLFAGSTSALESSVVALEEYSISSSHISLTRLLPTSSFFAIAFISDFGFCCLALQLYRCFFLGGISTCTTRVRGEMGGTLVMCFLRPRVRNLLVGSSTMKVQLSGRHFLWRRLSGSIS